MDRTLISIKSVVTAFFILLSPGYDGLAKAETYWQKIAPGMNFVTATAAAANAGSRGYDQCVRFIAGDLKSADLDNAEHVALVAGLDPDNCFASAGPHPDEAITRALKNCRARGSKYCEVFLGHDKLAAWAVTQANYAAEARVGTIWQRIAPGVQFVEAAVPPIDDDEKRYDSCRRLVSGEKSLKNPDRIVSIAIMYGVETDTCYYSWGSNTYAEETANVLAKCKSLASTCIPFIADGRLADWALKQAKAAPGRSDDYQQRLDAKLNAENESLTVYQAQDHAQRYADDRRQRLFDKCAKKWNDGYKSASNYKALVALYLISDPNDPRGYTDMTSCYEVTQAASEKSAIKQAFTKCKTEIADWVHKCYLFASGNAISDWGLAENRRIEDGSREALWQQLHDADEAEADRLRAQFESSQASSGSLFREGLSAALAAAGAYASARESRMGPVTGPAGAGVTSCPPGSQRVLNGYGVPATCQPYPGAAGTPLPRNYGDSDISGTR